MRQTPGCSLGSHLILVARHASHAVEILLRAPLLLPLGSRGGETWSTSMAGARATAEVWGGLVMLNSPHKLHEAAENKRCQGLRGQGSGV